VATGEPSPLISLEYSLSFGQVVGQPHGSHSECPPECEADAQLTHDSSAASILFSFLLFQLTADFFYCHNMQSLWFQTSTKRISPNCCRRSPTGSKIPLLTVEAQESTIGVLFQCQNLPEKPTTASQYILKPLWGHLSGLQGSPTHISRLPGISPAVSITLINLPALCLLKNL
jgi:hypothetical protein